MNMKNIKQFNSTQVSAIILILLSFSIICLGCSRESKKNIELQKYLQTLIDNLIDTQLDDPIHNVVLLVESKDFKWKGASGKADGKEELMTPNHKFKIASIAKTFTATIIIQLVEEGLIHLDDTIDKYLDNDMVKLDSLILYEDESYGRHVKIRQLLNHTSGIRDYMEDDRFIPEVLENPKKQYSPKLIMELYYKYNMNHKVFFKPGDQYDYSDVNYVLLAMIIENVIGKSYHKSLHKRIFDPLNMDNSYLEYYEEPRGSAPLSHAFFSSVDLIDEVSTSFEWGGGGIVSTCEEVNMFFRALLDGKLFKREETLELMIKEADKGLGGMDYDYGFGIQKRIIHGLTFYGHGGAYDCDAFYCPKENISIVMSLNQMETHGKRDEFLVGAIKLLNDYRNTLK